MLIVKSYQFTLKRQKNNQILRDMIYHLTLFILLFSSCSQAITTTDFSGNILEIPLSLDNGRPVIEVFINQKGPYKLFLDTGASTNVLDLGIAENAGLKVKEKVSLSSPVGGSIPAVDYGKVKYEIGEMSFENNEVTNRGMDRLTKSSGLDGVMSFRMFEDYTMIFDFKHKKLRLTKEEINKNAENAIKFESDNNIIALQAKIGDQYLSMDMDTGSPGSITLPYELANKINFESEPVEAGKIGLIDTVMTMYAAKLNDDFHLGSIVLKNADVRLTGFNGHGNLGMNFLMQYDVSIDQKNKLVLLDPNGMKISVVQPRVRINTVQKPSSQSDSFKDSGEITFTGTYNGDRKIWVSEGALKYQRGDAAVLNLKEKSDNTFELSLDNRNISLPVIQFNYNATKEVISITFIHNNGKKEGPFQKLK